MFVRIFAASGVAASFDEVASSVMIINNTRYPTIDNYIGIANRHRDDHNDEIQL